MELLPLIALIIIVCTVEGINTTDTLNNKTKRTLSQHLLNHGETGPILVYSATSNPPVLSSADYSSLKPEYEPTAQLHFARISKLYPRQPLQQVLQELPNLSNSHINPYPQPVNRDIYTGHYKEPMLSPLVNDQNHISTETVIPQQLSYPNRNVRYSLIPFRMQTYENEKNNFEFNTYPHSSFSYPSIKHFMYQPQAPLTVPLFPHQNSHYPKVQSVPIVNYINRNPQHHPQPQNLNAPKYVSLAVDIKRPVLHKKLLKNFSSLQAPLRESEAAKSENEDESAVKTAQLNEDANNEEKSNVQDEEHEEKSEFRKRPYEFEENEHFEYNDENDDSGEFESDNNRGSTPHVTFKKPPNRQLRNRNTHDYNTFRNSDYKREHSDYRPINNNSKSPKMVYKTIRYSKETKEPNDDSFEAKQSENIPITRKHRLFREKWYITKNSDNIEKK